MNLIFQFSPLALTFIIIVSGYFIGKIKISDISLDLSAVLIAAIISGVALKGFPQLIVADDAFFMSMKLISSLGTSLFVSAVGLSAGYMFRANNRLGNLFSFFVGAIMVAAAFLTVSVINMLDSNADRSVMLGILCGSLTSTPGLSAVNELSYIDSHLSTAGYGCAYIFGVVGAVLFVQICMKKNKRNCKYTIKILERSSSKAELQGLIQLAVTIILGTIIGGINIPNINFSLGSSGGILCVGMLIGTLISGINEEKIITNDIVSMFRSLGLVFFFVGSGVPAGMNLSGTIEVKYIFYGLAITVVTIALGYSISLIATKGSIVYSLCNVCGGMTSTPAIGVLSRRCDCEDGMAMYSIAYVGALFVMVAGVRIL